MSSPTAPVTPEAIMQLGLGFWASKTLLSAVELGVFSQLAGGGAADAPTLAARCGIHERGARDFFDALVALKMLRREYGRYANTPEADAFLDRNKPSYVGGILEMANTRLYRYWGELTAALRTGTPQNEAKHNPDHFAEMYSDPKSLRGFLAGMTGVSLAAAHALAAKFDWKNVRTFVDVGCAQGAVPLTLARTHPHLHGIGFDLPPVGPFFEEFIAPVHDRVRFQAGDMFKDALPSADAIILGHILHDWDLAGKKFLLRRAHDALPAGGRVIVYDTIIDDDRSRNAFGLLMSLNMLISTPGGFDYTAADCTAWMKEAGFRDIRVEHLVGPTSMVIGVK